MPSNPAEIPLRRGPRVSHALTLVGGTGEVVSMVGVDKFLEVFKRDTTFHIVPPAKAPSDTSAPASSGFIVKRIDGIGSSSPAVARILIQGSEMLRSGVFDEAFDKERILALLHACKEQLVICETTSKSLNERIQGVLKAIVARAGTPADSASSFTPFPHTPDLVRDTTSFLIHAKRAVSSIVALAAEIRGVPVTGTDFSKIGPVLDAAVGQDDLLARVVKAEEPRVKKIADLRNYQEHPSGKGTTTVLKDFHIGDTGKICTPMLHLSTDPPAVLHLQVEQCSRYLVDLAEAMYVRALWPRLRPGLPFVLQEIAECDVDANCPMRLRLSVDFAKFAVEPP